MDSITHVFLGAAIGQAVSNKRNNHKAALLGALASTAPDFDVFIQSSHNSLLGLEVHRSFTHSLMFIPFGALIILGGVLLFFKSMRKDWKFFLLVCLLAYGSHSLLDSCTSYGTQLFWPFSHERVSWDIIAIVDPVFTLCLITGASISWYKTAKKPARIGLICAAIYLVFCGFQHYRAIRAEEAFIKSQGQTATGVRVMPTFANVYSYNGLYFSDNRIYLNLVKASVFASAHVIAQGSVPLFKLENLPASLAAVPQLAEGAQIFSWFAQGYVAVATENPFVLVDMRYVEKKPHTVGLWGITLIKSQDQAQVERVSRVAVSS